MKVYDDESVDAFLTRRFGTKVARLFGSALVHGVYATDSRRLSVRSSFPSLWEAEDRGKGSVVTGILRKKEPSGTPEVFETGDMTNILTDASVFSFKDGINQLPLSLIERLSTMPSVEMRVSCGVSSIQPQQESILVRIYLERVFSTVDTTLLDQTARRHHDQSLARHLVPSTPSARFFAHWCSESSLSQIQPILHRYSRQPCFSMCSKRVTSSRIWLPSPSSRGRI